MGIKFLEVQRGNCLKCIDELTTIVGFSSKEKEKLLREIVGNEISLDFEPQRIDILSAINATNVNGIGSVTQIPF